MGVRVNFRSENNCEKIYGCVNILKYEIAGHTRNSPVRTRKPENTRAQGRTATGARLPRAQGGPSPKRAQSGPPGPRTYYGLVNCQLIQYSVHLLE